MEKTVYLHHDYKIKKMIDDELVRIGWIKFLDPKGYGFIIDLLDNSEYYFHKSFLIVDQLSDVVVSYKIRQSQRHQDKYEAYNIAPPFYYKREIIDKFDLYPKEIHEILQLYLPSIMYKENDTYKDSVKEVVNKYDKFIAELRDYVKSFDIEEFLKSYFVKTSFFYSASTKDWDINSLSYESYLIEPYSKLKSIFQRCANYEESLVWEYYQNRWYIYRVFDPYIDKISTKSQEIKSTTAYGYDTGFWNDLNKDEIDAYIPQITEKWKAEVRQTYNKKDHFEELIHQPTNRFSSIIGGVPTVVNQVGEKITYLNTPHFDVTLHYPNGSIQFQTTSYANAKGYGYKITRQINGKKTFIELRDLSVSDIDYKKLIEHTKTMKSEAVEMFQDMLLKYQVF